ncbi:uncharacterized protein LOC125227330 [Leguminivora glycinivorella]|uniref:uncharacterized protein LOC125227330 n=1 Tax=Leguminivora glycinivorella TaxID=1035111 RepID=UPI0020100AB1|nr:uncharacterized protein LOC125227330 [Leguminivora glycinivorella]
MSPLARSLLALAALLAAADADCSTEMIGHVTKTDAGWNLYEAAPGGDVIYLPKTYYITDTVGAKIIACNKDPSAPPPVIEVATPTQFSKVTIACYEDECPEGATVNVTKYIEDYWVVWP